MIFIALMQLLGDHIPALGAFLSTLVLFVLTVHIAWRGGYKRGVRDTSTKWVYDVEHNPKLISQDIREKLEREKAEANARADAYKERLREYLPIFRSTALQLDDLAKSAKTLAEE